LPPLPIGFLTALECTRFVFGWGSATDPAGGAYSAPPDPVGGLRGPTSRGRRGEGEKCGREVGRRPLCKFLDPPWLCWWDHGHVYNNLPY